MVYQYVAIDKKGKRLKGTIEGNGKEEILGKLKDQGLYLLDLTEKNQSILKKEIELGKVIKIEELVVFTRQMATLLKSGVTIIDAIFILREQTENKRLKKVLKQMEEDLRKGDSISNAMAAHPRAFPALLINMVKAGEVAGNLDETLNSAALFYERENNTRKKVKSALTYPVVVSILAVFVTIFLLIKVVPQFVQIFADFGAELPLPTRIVLGVSHFIQHQWYVLLLSSALLVVVYMILNKYRHTKYYIDYIKLKIPVFGKLLQKAVIARFARTFSSLLTSAVPILQALTMVSQVVDNEAIAEPIRQAKNNLRQGNALHEPLKKYGVFPPLLTHMMAIGEETGALEEMLDKVADFYESDVDNMTDQLKGLIEPLMIVFLAVIVGLIILSVLLPMFEIYNLIG